MTLLTSVNCFVAGDVDAIAIVAVTKTGYAAYRKSQPAAVAAFLDTIRFKPEADKFALVTTAEGRLDHIVTGIVEPSDAWSLAHLPARLPEGIYRFDDRFLPEMEDAKARLEALAFGWSMGCYRFEAFRKEKMAVPRLALDDGTLRRRATELAISAYLARDLINLPANHLGPQELIEHAVDMARVFKAEIHQISGERLLAENYPAIFAVGKASVNTPGLVDIRWGDPSHPKVTLVGKGVCFDTGGLDLKPSQFMKLMKKDMGGAALTLALARTIMANDLPVRLRLLIPAVENSVAGNAFRPQDILATRKGLTVEIGNTDAEGRLILCDALHEADQEMPGLLIDCATLTGAARVALGTDVPAFFTPDDRLAKHLERVCREVGEPMWRLPLHAGYEDLLESKIADLNNAPDSSYAGAITAALFLKRFVEKTACWLHVDLMAWNIKARPGRPVGGEAQGLRALYRLIAEFAAA